MAKRKNPWFSVLILGILVATAVFFQARPLGSSDQIAEAKDGFNNLCRIFVKGDHAYVLRRAPAIMEGYLWVFDVGVVGDSIEDTTFTESCFTEFIPYARDVFVSGEYLYVVRHHIYPYLRKYSIPDGCNLDSIDEDGGTMGGAAFTDMYITGNRAYLSADSGEVSVFEVSGDTVKYLWNESFNVPKGSEQGVYVRGRYAYLAAQGQALWVHDLSDGSNYQAAPPDTPYSSRDVYNVACGGSSRTYEITNEDGFHIWNTDDPADTIDEVGCSGINGYIVHITGNFAYLLHYPGSVCVCPLVCDGSFEDPDFYGENSHDFHVVHDGTGNARIYGVYPDDTDTGVVLWYVKADSHTINPYFYGDVNADTSVDAADSSTLHRYVVDGDTASVNLDACDVNCDGEVNTDDLDHFSNFLYHGGKAPGADCQFYHYVFGDANGDRIVNSSDIVYLNNYLFYGGPPPEPMAAGDPNLDCEVNSADMIYLIIYLFLGGRAPQQGCAE